MHHISRSDTADKEIDTDRSDKGQQERTHPVCWEGLKSTFQALGADDSW